MNSAPTSKPDSVGFSFERGSKVTEMSDLHAEKQPSQITSTDKGM
jgi:hypothetical protein